MNQMTEEQMTLVEHITELRKRVIYVLAALIFGLIVGFILANPIYDFLRNTEPAKQLSLNSFSLWDGIGIYMKFAFIVALALALPTTLYQVWAFVSPGLRATERKAALRYVPFVFLLFVLGVAFAYFVVFPMAFQFTSNINKHLELTETYGITQYFAFMFNIILPLSLLFELPVVIMFLTRIRILNPLRLRKMRRFAYFGLIVLATFISPPDIVSDILVAIPLLVLYEISVILSATVFRKQLEEDMKWEQQYEDDADKTTA
ncbi:twin-arginine translocase subunit TatC [Paenibacillus sp. 481]|uniref:twin-arginine translocase subunit TatC n=1 Tax=Paenibacillus sp. 481 TaxID=2835869 RepID=UPI001E2A63BB|nr:twin-arginine translocase subunit TatC [Paenibacillus sp. 481]UHA76083.1 twin-arginine translocase subunit TatC [Paenibacillus sp. 481]